MVAYLVLGIILIIMFSVWYAKKVDNNPKHKFYKNLDSTIISSMNDSPIGFGYKTSWFAIKANSPKDVLASLGLSALNESNWENGINNSYGNLAFITPSIDGWVLITGTKLVTADSKKNINKISNTLNTLSEEFGEAQFFSTHRVVEFHCWIKSINGKTNRVYSFLGEANENIAVSGLPSVFEKRYKLVNSFLPEAKAEEYWESENLTYPDEDLVMQIAGDWSINPSILDANKTITSLGVLVDSKSLNKSINYFK